MAVFFSSSPFAAFGNPFGFGAFNPQESNVAGVSGLRVFGGGLTPSASGLGPAFAPTLTGQSVFNSGLFGGLFAPQTSLLQDLLVLSLLNGAQGSVATGTAPATANNAGMADVERFFANAKNAKDGNASPTKALAFGRDRDDTTTSHSDGDGVATFTANDGGGP